MLSGNVSIQYFTTPDLSQLKISMHIGFISQFKRIIQCRERVNAKPHVSWEWSWHIAGRPRTSQESFLSLIYSLISSASSASFDTLTHHLTVHRMCLCAFLTGLRNWLVSWPRRGNLTQASILAEWKCLHQCGPSMWLTVQRHLLIVFSYSYVLNQRLEMLLFYMQNSHDSMACGSLWMKMRQASTLWGTLELLSTAWRKFLLSSLHATISILRSITLSMKT